MAAVTVFADPSVEFGLQFTRAGDAALDRPTPAPVTTLPAAERSGEDGIRLAPAPIEQAGTEPAARQAEEPAEPTADQASERTKEAEKIVTLDRFRKK